MIIILPTNLLVSSDTSLDDNMDALEVLSVVSTPNICP